MSGSGNSNYLLQNLSSLGLGYAIAIALGFLVLLSTVLLASYVCCRAAAIPTTSFPNPNVSHPSPNGVVLPHIIFVAEEDDIDDRVATGEREDHAVLGLAAAAINSYPKFAFSKSKGDSGDSVCSICLCDYREGEMLRMLPDCCHFFHLCCVDAWLRLNASCPICRTSPLPTPVSTPLLETVPLSHFPAHGRR